MGNRQALRLSGRPVVAYRGANALNEYATVDNVPFAYDLNGNLRDDGQQRYTFNYRNQLVRVVETAANVERLRQCYDAVGRVIAIVEGGSAAHLIVDGLHVVEEYVNGGVRRQYVYEHGIDRRCQMVAGGEEWWFHTDPI